MLIDIEPIFNNTTAKASYNGDELMAYRIYPDEGYLLHTSSYDEAVLDEDGNETGEVKIGYTESFISLNKNYDFDENPFEVYVVSKAEVEQNNT